LAKTPLIHTLKTNHSLNSFKIKDSQDLVLVGWGKGERLSALHFKEHALRVTFHGMKVCKKVISYNK
jgi:hypothetical protein